MLYYINYILDLCYTILTIYKIYAICMIYAILSMQNSVDGVSV